MKFDPKTNKVIIDTLNKEEAKQYIIFLLLERFRHGDCILMAGKCKGIYRDKGDRPMRAFFDSAILRHGEDAEEIGLLIEIVKEKFALGRCSY